MSWDELMQNGLGQISGVQRREPVSPGRGGPRGGAEPAPDRGGRAAWNPGPWCTREYLTGLAAWQATVYPSPLCWGATFDPDLIERMGAQIGVTMRRLGVHQGLAQVLDVLRDLRWGRAEETIRRSTPIWSA